MQTLPALDLQDTRALVAWLFAPEPVTLAHTCPCCGVAFACAWDGCLCAIDATRFLCGPCTRRATRG